MLVAFLITIFNGWSPSFACRFRFCSHLIERALHSDGRVVDDLLAIVLRRIVFAKLLFLGLVDNRVLCVGLIVDRPHVGVDVGALTSLAAGFELCGDPLLHLDAIGFDLLFAFRSATLTLDDRLLTLLLLGGVSSSSVGVNLRHFDVDIDVVVEQAFELDPSFLQEANGRVPH